MTIAHVTLAFTLVLGCVAHVLADDRPRDRLHDYPPEVLVEIIERQREQIEQLRAEIDALHVELAKLASRRSAGLLPTQVAGGEAAAPPAAADDVPAGLADAIERGERERRELIELLIERRAEAVQQSRSGRDRQAATERAAELARLIQGLRAMPRGMFPPRLGTPSQGQIGVLEGAARIGRAAGTKIVRAENGRVAPDGDEIAVVGGEAGQTMRCQARILKIVDGERMIVQTGRSRIILRGVSTDGMLAGRWTYTRPVRVVGTGQASFYPEMPIVEPFDWPTTEELRAMHADEGATR